MLAISTESEETDKEGAILLKDDAMLLPPHPCDPRKHLWSERVQKQEGQCCPTPSKPGLEGKKVYEQLAVLPAISKCPAFQSSISTESEEMDKESPGLLEDDAMLLPPVQCSPTRTMSPYEILRIERIARNEARLRKLGLMEETVQRVKKSEKPKKK